MSTICFDLQRLDNNYVAIKHVKFGTSEYNYHRALHFTNHTNGVKKNWWLEDSKYKYIWVLVGYTKDDYEEICFVCNDKVWTNRVKRSYDKKERFYQDYISTRIIKIPFEKVGGWSLEHKFKLYKENDLGENFVLYIPENIRQGDFE